MTQEQYCKMKSLKNQQPYVGKHERSVYKVWRVIGPGGPVEILDFYGIDTAVEAVAGCWDYEITNLRTNKTVPDSVISAILDRKEQTHERVHRTGEKISGR